MWDGKLLKAFSCSIVVLLLLMWATKVHTQDATFHENYSNGTYSLRWVVKNTNDWQSAVSNGFYLSKRNLTTGQTEEFKIANTTGPYLSLGKDSEDERYLLAFFLQNGVDHNQFLRDEFDLDEIEIVDINDTRRYLCEYILNTNYDLIMESGFGFRDTAIARSNMYEYELLLNTTNGGRKSLATFQFNPSLWEEPKLPNLEASWANKRVELKWKTKEHKSKYYAYHLEGAEGSSPFQILDSLIVNPMDSSEIEAFHSIVSPQNLPNNDSIYTFRLSAYDFLGLRTSLYTEVSGSSNMGIGASPKIESADLLDNNTVELKYNIYDIFQDQVKEWRIYIGEAWDGPYKLDTSGIAAQTLALIRPLLYEDNYFRVVAVDANQIEHSSFPMLVTHLDTIAPAVPINLKGIIDSSGVVNLTWSSNEETDFYGYKVFFGFDTTREMTLAHPRALPQAVFQDTIGLKSLNRKLFYKVTAIDNRNNRSDFSKIIELKKPDVIAPMEASFHLQKSGPGKVFLAWFPSTSNDVIVQRLFRRAIEDEETWSLIKEWELGNLDTSYVDTGLEGLKTYAYILTVQDSSKNTSLPSAPAVVKTLPDHSSVDLSAWRVEQEGQSISIQHDLSDPQIYQINIYKQIEDEKPFELTNLRVRTLEYIDQSLVRNKEIKYFIQVIYNDGFKSPYSSKKSIILD